MARAMLLRSLYCWFICRSEDSGQVMSSSDCVVGVVGGTPLGEGVLGALLQGTRSLCGVIAVRKAGL